jgi:hypothetical protein
MVCHVLRHWFITVVVFVAAFGAAAEESESLFRAELVVASKDEASRDDNLRRALTMVLGRVINRESMSSKPVGSMLLHPANYVDEFEYLSGKDTTAADLMRVRFDEDAILRTLQRSGVRVWVSGRPDIVIWLWTFDPPGRQLVILHESPQFEQPLALAAGNRRLRWLAPLGDLTDQSSLSAADGESGNLQRIREATWRYESEFALVGELRRSGEQTWDASWRFVGLAGSDAWQVRALDLDAALIAGVDGVFDRLVKLYAVVGQSSAVFELDVDGISSMQDADRCGAYLRSLPSVTRADWLKAEANRATWRLTVAGRPEAIVQMLSVSRSLRRVDAPGGQQSAASYRWLP